MAETRYRPLPDLPEGAWVRGAVCQIAQLYRDVLGRPPDAGGMAAYLRAIGSGKTIETILAEFLAGPEFRARLVPEPADRAAYVAMLRRMETAPCPDPAPLTVLSPADRRAYHWWCESYEVPWQAGLPAGAAIAYLTGPSWPDTLPKPRGVPPADAAWLVLLPFPCRVAASLAAEIGLAGRDPARQLIYCDEDRMDPDGTRHTPWFKLGEALPVAPHAALAVRADLAEALGLTADGVVAADVAPWPARIAALPASAVCHLPRVLVHRLEPGLAVARGRPRLRQGLAGPGEGPLVSVLIPTRERMDLLAPLIEDLLYRTAYRALEILVVDNDSRLAESRAYLDRLGARHPACRVLPMPGPFNWAEANNLAAAAARGAVLVLMNNDMRVLDPEWLTELVAEACDPRTGIVGAALTYPDGTVQHAGMRLMADGTAQHVMRHAQPDCRDYQDLLFQRRRVSAVTGACMAMRRAVLDAAGGLDAARYRITCSDVDLCLRVAALGLEIIWTPAVRLAHLELASRGADGDGESGRRAAAEQAALVARWGEALRADPCWSANLAASEGPPALAFPPGWAGGA